MDNVKPIIMDAFKFNNPTMEGVKMDSVKVRGNGDPPRIYAEFRNQKKDLILFSRPEEFMRNEPMTIWISRRIETALNGMLILRITGKDTAPVIRNLEEAAAETHCAYADELALSATKVGWLWLEQQAFPQALRPAVAPQQRDTSELSVLLQEVRNMLEKSIESTTSMFRVLIADLARIKKQVPAPAPAPPAPPKKVVTALPKDRTPKYLPSAKAVVHAHGKDTLRVLLTYDLMKDVCINPDNPGLNRIDILEMDDDGCSVIRLSVSDAKHPANLVFDEKASHLRHAFAYRVDPKLQKKVSVGEAIIRTVKLDELTFETP